MQALNIIDDLRNEAKAAAAQYGIPADLHPEDQLLRHIHAKWGAVAGKKYFEGGHLDAVKIRQQILNLRHPKDRLKIMDFAAGFGRITRHLAHLMPEHDVMASDIHPNACTFLQDTLNIRAFVSATDPAELSIGDDYDVIFVMSLFSHLPDKSFGRWLGALFERVAPGGFLFFTANGRVTLDTFPAFYGEIFPEGARYGFRAESDQHDLDSAEYGSMIISIRYGLDMIDQYAPEAILQSYSSGGWLGTQDGWILKRPA